ncbi:hypothetical protein ACB092_05G126600 [Castanea dentata]
MLRGMILVPIWPLEKNLDTVNRCHSRILQWRKISLAKTTRYLCRRQWKTGVFSKLQNAQEVDVKTTPAVSLPKKYHDSDMSSMDMEFLPPPPPPYIFF